MHLILSQDKTLRSVIDLGCGMGNFLLELKAANQFTAIIGLDFVKETCALARQHQQLFQDITFIQGSLIDLPFQSHCFDVSFCLNVLHHIHPSDLYDVIKEIERITNKYMVLEIRNKRSIFHGWYHYVVRKKYQKNLPIYTSQIAEINDLVSDFTLVQVIGKHRMHCLNHRLLLVFAKKKVA